ncbi:MAG: prenyltransferase [Gammaproteobacteria bacterium]|nr:prenyltransferase [Gammaproteobacteria bacterium]
MISGALRTDTGTRALTLWRAARPPFLLMSVVCVLLGIAVAWRSGATLAWLDVTLVLVGALAAHASVNLFNEYEDARSGLDAHTTRTPFSGGSGALQDDPEAMRAVRGSALMMLSLTVVIGAWCVARHGPLLLPIGALGVALVLAYTPWINRHPLLCLVAPGLGVGSLQVLGVVAVLNERLSLLAITAALVPGLLGSSLLLANQFPDIEADRAVGRRHLAIAYGRRRARRVFASLAVATAGVVVMAVTSGVFPPLAWLSLLPLSAMLPTVIGLARHAAGAALTPYLASNVAASLLTPLVLAWALWRG